MYLLSPPRVEKDPQRYASLLEMADVVSRHHHPGDLFRELAPRLRAVTSFDSINFAIYDHFHDLMKLHVWEGSDGLKAPLEVSVQEAAVGWVWKNQSAL